MKKKQIILITVFFTYRRQKNLSVMSAILLHDISIFFLTNIFSLATYKVL